MYYGFIIKSFTVIDLVKFDLTYWYINVNEHNFKTIYAQKINQYSITYFESIANEQNIFKKANVS